MQIRLWEWTVADGARSCACGVSSTRHEAMDALSLTLISENDHARGSVVPVMLVNGIGPLPLYMRSGPVQFAEYERGVVTWRTDFTE